MPSEDQTDCRTRLPAIFEYRAAAARRRAAAFCDLPDVVAGITLAALTPRTFSMLLAQGNRFICATRGETIDDVLDYLWIHAPNHTHCGIQGWQIRKRAHLAPFMRLLTHRGFFFSLVGRLSRRRRRAASADPSAPLAPITRAEQAAATLVVAITDIRAVVAEAFADTTAATGRPGAPIATLEAHFIHNLAMAYQWTPERTRATPLKQLFQLDRCQRRAAGEDVVDSGEQALMAAHLARRQAALDASVLDESVQSVHSVVNPS